MFASSINDISNMPSIKIDLSIILISAEHQSPEDDHGPGAHPKEKTFKTEDPAETTKENATELDHKGTYMYSATN